MFIISNELFDKKIVMILRSDIIFLQMTDSESLYFDFLLEVTKRVGVNFSRVMKCFPSSYPLTRN